MHTRQTYQKYMKSIKVQVYTSLPAVLQLRKTLGGTPGAPAAFSTPFPGGGLSRPGAGRPVTCRRDVAAPET